MVDTPVFGSLTRNYPNANWTAVTSVLGITGTGANQTISVIKTIAWGYTTDASGNLNAKAPFEVAIPPTFHKQEMNKHKGNF